LFRNGTVNIGKSLIQIPSSNVLIEKMKSLDILAGQYFHAFYKKEWLGECEPAISELSIAEAYQVQNMVARKRVQAGEKIVGYKIGCTSSAIRSQFGLTEPINGNLFQPHVFEANVVIDWSDYNHCAIEPEMVLKIGREIRGENLSDSELIDSVEYVSSGIEIHNFKFWNPPPTLQELICSGGIHAGLVVGSAKVSPRDLFFKDEVFYVYKDEVLVTSGPASEIMGGPLHSLRWLVGFLTKKGLSLRKNSLVIPGSPVELVTVDQDTKLKVAVENVGSVVAFFKKHKKEF